MGGRVRTPALLEADDGLGGTLLRKLREGNMPTVRFTVHTSLSRSDTMAVLTDFGPDRARRWPNVDEAHFIVHELGPDHAEVTEGTAVAWERERYSWNAATGIVTIETLDSNLWGPGSGWHFELTPADGGTDVHVTVTRRPRSLVGRLVGAALPVAGARTLGKQFRSVLRKAETS